MGPIEHLAVLYRGSSALATCRHLISVHLIEAPNPLTVRIAADCAERAIE